MAQFSEQDLILLNSYLDGRLDSSERTAIEGRLAGDAALRAELESLRGTVELLKKAERVPVPRNFTLNPAAFAAPARRSFLERIGLGAMPGWALATASMVLVALCAGVLVLRPFSGGSPTSVALAPMVMPAATEAPAEEAGAQMAAEAPTEEATEAGTEEMMLYAVTETPSEEPVPLDATGAKMIPGTSGPPMGGATGGMGGAGGTDGAGVPPNPATAGQDGVTGEAFDSQNAQTEAAASGPVADTANASRSALAETATPPYTAVVGEEVNPWDRLSEGGWAILVGGTGLLIAIVVGMAVLRRRH